MAGDEEFRRQLEALHRVFAYLIVHLQMMHQYLMTRGMSIPNVVIQPEDQGESTRGADANRRQATARTRGRNPNPGETSTAVLTQTDPVNKKAGKRSRYDAGKEAGPSKKTYTGMVAPSPLDLNIEASSLPRATTEADQTPRVQSRTQKQAMNPQPIDSSGDESDPTDPNS